MYSPFYRRTFVIVTLVVISWALFKILEPLWTTLGWAAVLAFLLHPLHERLTKKFKGRESLSAGLLTGLTPFFVMAPIAFLGVIFARQVGNIINAMSGTTPWPTRSRRRRSRTPPASWRSSRTSSAPFFWPSTS